ncbi:hypothetical protein ABZ023_27520 [Streptomyces sp. NPDC006367]|uniref:hypothetical protein n=1 Tax=unclassified Streptomyces TaxID=2593676 RepID=UPI0033B631CD
MRPSPDLAGKIERAEAAVNAFLQARSRMDDFEAVARAVRRYPGLDAEGRTRRGEVRRDYAAVVLRDLLTDLALWEDVHGHGGQEMLRQVRARWNRHPYKELDGPGRHLAAALISFAAEHSVSLRDAADRALATYTEEWLDTESHWKQHAAQGSAPQTTGLRYSLHPAASQPSDQAAEDLYLPTAMAALGAFLAHDRPGHPTQITQLLADGSHRPVDQAALWQDVLEEAGTPGEWLYIRAARFEQAYLTWKEAAHRADPNYLEPVSREVSEESNHSPVMIFSLLAALKARDEFEFQQEEYERSPAQALDEALRRFLRRTGLPYAPDDPETAAALLAHLAQILDTQGLPGRLLLKPTDTTAPAWPEQTGLAGQMAALLEERMRGTEVPFAAVLQQAQVTYDTHWSAEHDHRAEQSRSGIRDPRSPVRYMLSGPALTSIPAYEQPCPNAAVAWMEFLQHDSPQRPVEITADLADGRRVTVGLSALAQAAHLELHHDDAWNEYDWPMATDRTAREEQAQAFWLRRQLANASARPDRAAPRRERIEAVFGSADQALAFLRDQAGQATPSASTREAAALHRAEAVLTRLFAQVPDTGRADRLRDAASAVIAESAARQKDLAAGPPPASAPPAAAEQTDQARHQHQHQQPGGPTPGTATPHR